MRVFSQKSVVSRSKKDGERESAHAVSVDSVGEWYSVLNIIREEFGPSGSGWWSNWVGQEVPPLFSSKLRPEIYVRRQVLEFLVHELGFVELPVGYYDLVVYHLKLDFWREQGIRAWPEFDYGEASAYFRKKERWLISRLLSSGEIVRNVSGSRPTRECDVVERSWVLKSIHGWIEIFDRGQRRRLNPGLLTDVEVYNLLRGEPVFVDETDPEDYLEMDSHGTLN